MSSCRHCGTRTRGRRICDDCSAERNARQPVRQGVETADGDRVGSWIRVGETWHASIRFDGNAHEFACGERFEDFPADDAAIDHSRVSPTAICPGCADALEDVQVLEGGFSSAGELRADGSGHVCDACGETFRTLTKLRLHERNDCSGREEYGRVDPDAPDVGLQTAEGLLTCRGCDRQNPDAEFDQTTSFAAGDYHLIVEFACRFCGFENENRAVMEGVDRDDLGRLPVHLQPDEIGGDA